MNWTNQEVLTLYKYSHLPAKTIARKIRTHTVKAIREKARRSHLQLPRTQHRWKKGEFAVLKDSFKTLTAKELGKKLGRTENAVYNKARALGYKLKTEEKTKKAAAFKKPTVIWEKDDGYGDLFIFDPFANLRASRWVVEHIRDE